MLDLHLTLNIYLIIPTVTGHRIRILMFLLGRRASRMGQTGRKVLCMSHALDSAQCLSTKSAFCPSEYMRG